MNDTLNAEEAQLIQRDHAFQVAAGQTLQQALDSLGLPAELYLAVRDGELMQAAAEIQPGDQIRLVGVLAGG